MEPTHQLTNKHILMLLPSANTSQKVNGFAHGQYHDHLNCNAGALSGQK
jgi:hypothetical protein